MAALHVTSENFEAEVLQAEVPVVVDFFATWCGPCQMMAPLIDQLADEMTDAKFVKVDTDKEQEIAAEFRIMSIPTLVVIKNGKEVKRSVGMVSKQDVLKLLA